MTEKANERKILYYLCFPKSSPMFFKWGLDELQHEEPTEQVSDSASHKHQ